MITVIQDCGAGLVLLIKLRTGGYGDIKPGERVFINQGPMPGLLITYGGWWTR
jgi:hypothetical protein